ncbi:hypothetical protein [Bradyrhizobium cytisi]|uniref:hypothetical protein n=1 Tax=Bradyrhizobium cytisi TaxID=515489 RepID=UPI0016533B19|nr:hypothetical protein [Bradyrhizobium cytisi]
MLRPLEAAAYLEGFGLQCGAIRLDCAMVGRLRADMGRRTIEMADAIAAMGKA